MAKDEKSEKLEESDQQEKNDDKKIKKDEERQQDDTKDRLLRLAAEFDNYKKRVVKETDEARTIGKAELMKKIISVLDEFELAITALSESKDENLKKGMELIYSNLISTLKGEGLKVVETDGIYDPYKHEIIMIKESDKKPGTILETVRKGYQLNSILLRPASVIVAKEIEKKEEDDTKTQ